MIILPAMAGGALAGGSEPLLLADRRHRPHAAGRDRALQPQPERPHARQARGHQPDRLGQGPRRSLPDRRAGARRPAGARLRDPRAVERQHRHLAGHDLPAARLPLAVVMPDNVTRERRQLLEIYGATIVDSPAELGSNGAVALARRMAAEDPRYVMPDQYANPHNPRAHYETTGARDPGRLPRDRRLRRRPGHGRHADGRRPSAARGQARRARSTPPSRCPASWSRACARSRRASCPRSSTPSVLDGRFLVTTAESIEALRRLTATEGIFAGVSSGGVLAVASRVAEQMDVGHDRCAACRRRLEVPVRGRLARDLEDESSGGAQPVVRRRAAADARRVGRDQARAG